MSSSTSAPKQSEFIRYLRLFLEWSQAMNYSVETTKTRDTCVRRFIVWCDDRAITRPQDITASVLERYRRYLFHYRKSNGAPLAFSTQHSHLAPIKAFFKWLNKENHILYNPASEFELPRVPKHLPKDFFSEEEIDAMIEHTQIYGDLGIRDRAIIETFYSSGIRRMELVNLKLQDVDLKRGTLVVFEGKYKKDRVVPIGKRACNWVDKYMTLVRPSLIKGDDNGFTFLTEKGQPFIKNRISDLVKKYKQAVGVDKPGACQLFRRSMATHMLENGADIRYIQEILGHVNLSTTQIYTQVSIKKLKQVHASTHPAR